MILPEDMFEFCYFFDLQGSLRELAHLALPEPWQFLHPKASMHYNNETPILERYIRNVYRYQAISYNLSYDPVDKARCFSFHGAWECFHTGLFTSYFQSIYALFELNRRRDTRYDWVFKGFFAESSPKLKVISVLPSKPCYGIGYAYHPEWDIRINFSHILQDENNLQRIPTSVRKQNNLPLLLHASVLYARRLAAIDPSIIVPQLYSRQIQFLMPICLTDVQHCDLAMTLNACEGYYYGSTCLTLEMAYTNARMLSRPSAPWLLNLVQENVPQNKFEYESIFGMYSAI